MAGVVLSRELRLSHADFFRTLPHVLAGYPVQISGAVVVVDEVQRRLTLRLAPAEKRRIASLCLPLTQVTFEFSGYSEEDISAFMERFARHFQRGGG
jgi:hypothetical protein